MERLTMTETCLDVFEASLEELYQVQRRLLGVESSEEAESRIDKIESLVNRLTEDTKDSVTGTRTARYWVVPSKIDHQRSIEVEIDRRRSIEREIDRRRSIEREIDCRRSIEEEKGKKKRKRKEKKRGRKNTSPACRRRPRVACPPSPPAGRLRAVFASGSPTRYRRPQVARGHGRDRFFSRARRQSVSPCEETDRGDVK
ncbi:hypothetical protein BHE74_00002070 [Ensete ventricosum]|nr:hypothetical protein BHE74_00002070 [Ensete ventricosum]